MICGHLLYYYHKKSSLRDQRAIPKYKNQRSKNFESGESKKKIVKAKFRVQNLRFFIKIREKADEMTHPLDEKGAKMMHAFSGRFCHKKERSKCYISPFPTHNFDFKSARNTCFCQMSFTFCIFYVLLWLLFKIKFLTLPRKFLICLT
jgi:hypothetical protein